jgi:hypothetical protein
LKDQTKKMKEERAENMARQKAEHWKNPNGRMISH